MFYMSHDKPNMYKEAYRLLEEIKFPTQNRVNINKSAVKGFVLGLTKHRIHNNDFLPSSRNSKYPQLYKHLKRMMRERFPGFRYQAIQVNKDVKSKLHVDRGNLGPSVIFAVGEFTGGKLFIEGKGERVIKNKMYKFDGNTPHKAMPHTVRRYSIVFFQYMQKKARGLKVP